MDIGGELPDVAAIGFQGMGRGALGLRQVDLERLHYFFYFFHAFLADIVTVNLIIYMTGQTRKVK